jgi:FkbM family methyltransferase
MIKKVIRFPLIVVLTYLHVRKTPIASHIYTWKELFWVKIYLYLKSLFYNPIKEISIRFKGKELNAPNLITLEYLFDEIFVNGEYYHPEIKIKINTIFDCGANIGFSTIFFKILYPEAKVLCFEPNPNVLFYLKQNIVSNNLSNVEIFPIALYKHNTNLDLFFNDKISLTSSIKSSRLEFEKKISVSARPLSEFMITEKPELVKIDVEGAEIFIIEDLIESSTLDFPIYYFLEYHNYGEVNSFTTILQEFSIKRFQYQLQAKINHKNIFQDHLILLWR